MLDVFSCPVPPAIDFKLLYDVLVHFSCFNAYHAMGRFSRQVNEIFFFFFFFFFPENRI